MLFERKDEKPFISLDSPRGIALTSLDKYIEQRKQIKPTPILPPVSPNDNPKETIASLQKEQSVLCEELNAERRRNENLGSTFKRAQSLSSSQYIEKLNNIASQLHKVQNPSSTIKEALNMINQIISAEQQFIPGTLRSQSMIKSPNHNDSSREKYQKENEKIEKEINRVQSEKDQLQAKLEELQAEIEKNHASKKALVEKLRYYYDTFKKRDAAWKEKAKKMHEQIQGSNVVEKQ